MVRDVETRHRRGMEPYCYAVRCSSPTDKSIKNRFTVKKLHIKRNVGDGVLDVPFALFL